MANACSIQDPQRAIALGTPGLRIERIVRRATQRPIELWSKCGTRETMGKRRACEFRRTIGYRC